jgi:hypothetical protein
MDFSTQFENKPSASDVLFTRLDTLPQRIVVPLLGMLGFLLWVRLFGFTWLFSVNMPFSDQWSFLSPLYDGFQWGDLPSAFFYQHGPHRQGLSFALMLPIYAISDWNVRLDSFIIALICILCGFLALRLRRKLVPGAPMLWDACLLLAFWGVNTFETIYITPNASHSIFPLFLVLTFANVWLWQSGWQRNSLLFTLIFVTIFTGFGLSIIPIVFILAVFQLVRKQWLDGLVLLIGLAITIAIFSLHYRFQVSAEGFQVLQPNPLNYLLFVISMFNYFFLFFLPRYTFSYFPIGVVFIGAVLGVSLTGIYQLVKQPKQNEEKNRFWETLLFLAGASLTYAGLTAYGRVQLGLNAANVSRYMALLLPAFAAVYFALLQVRERLNPLLLPLLLVVMCVRTVPETYLAYKNGVYYSSFKLCWFEGYQSQHKVTDANQLVEENDTRDVFQEKWLAYPERWDSLASQQAGPFDPEMDLTALEQWYPQPCAMLK